MNPYFSDSFDTDSASTLPVWFTDVVGTWGVVANAGAYSPPNDLQCTSHNDGDKVLILGGSGVTIPATADMVLESVTKTFQNDSPENGVQYIVRSDSSAQNYYVFLMQASGAGGTIGFQLYKSISGSLSQVGGNNDSGFVYPGGIALRVKVAAIGSTISAKVWQDGTVEPSAFQVNVTDVSISAPGYAGFYNAGNSSGYSVDSVQIFGNSSLAAGSLSSSNVLTTSLTVTCTAGSGGTSPYTYQWYRSTNSGFVPQSTNIISGATGLTLNDSDLTANTTYYYVLIATDNTDARAWSSQLSVTTASASATDFTLTPPSQTTFPGVSTGNYTLTPNGTPSSSTTIVLSDGVAGGTFKNSGGSAITSLVFTTSVAQTFTYVPATGSGGNTATLSASATSGFSASHNASCVIMSTAATDFTLAPSSLTTSPTVATSDYTITLNGTLASNETIGLTDGNAGGTFTPPALTFTSGNAGAPQTFTYMPAFGTGGSTKTLAVTGFGAFSSTHNISCVVTLPLTPGVAFATYVGVKTVQLSASVPTGGSGSYSFQWYRSTTSGTLGSSVRSATAESLIDPDLTAGTNYFYTIAYTDTGTGATGNSAQIEASTLPLTALETVGGLGDSIMAGSFSTVQTPFSALIDQLNFGLPFKEWYGGSQTGGTNGGINLSLNKAVSGTKTADWLPGSSLLPVAAAAWNSTGVNRIIINLGANDAQQSIATSISTYKSNLQAIITYLFSNVSTLKTVHLASPTFQGEESGNYSVQNSELLIGYGQAIAELANGSTICAGQVEGPYNYFQRRSMLQRSADLLHPTDAGDQATGAMWAVGSFDP